MHIGVLGCGALGGVIAAGLWEKAAAGRAAEDWQVTVINRNPRIAEAWAKGGLRVRALGGRASRGWAHAGQAAERIAHPALVGSPAESPRPFDLVVLTAKSAGLAEAARGLLPYLSDGGFLVTTQNGLIGLDLAGAAEGGAGAGEGAGGERPAPGRPAAAGPAGAAAGPLPVVPGTVLWGASMDEPGTYRVTARGPFILGEAGGGPASARLLLAADALSGVFPVLLSSNIRGVLWSKLAITASFTSLGAVTGLRFGELVRRADVRRLLLGIGMEVGRVAEAEGVRLEPLGGGLDLRRLLSAAGTGYPRWLRMTLMRLVGRRHRRTESSMLASLRRGRKTEAEFINGRVVRLAEKHGLDAPLNRAVCGLVAELEAGRRAPGLRNLEAFAPVRWG